MKFTGAAILIATGVFSRASCHPEAPQAKLRGKVGQTRELADEREEFFSSNRDTGDDPCTSPLIDRLKEKVEHLVYTTPTRCCGHDGPTAVYITHSHPAFGEALETQDSGFEQFWNEIHDTVADVSANNDVCYVMTGYDPDSGLLEDTLHGALQQAASSPYTSAIIATLPLNSEKLLTEMRSIAESRDAPPIGVMNTGFERLEQEAMTLEELGEGRYQRIPYTGYLNGFEFGRTAGRLMSELLGDGTTPSYKCFNHRTDITHISPRCDGFHAALNSKEAAEKTSSDVQEVQCNEFTTADDIEEILGNDEEVNAIFTQAACCRAVAEAVSNMPPDRILHVACADETAENLQLLDEGKIDFIATQPIFGQAYAAASWATGPVLAAIDGKLPQPYDKKLDGTFPDLGSLVHTQVYTIQMEQREISNGD